MPGSQSVPGSGRGILLGGTMKKGTKIMILALAVAVAMFLVITFVIAVIFVVSLFMIPRALINNTNHPVTTQTTSVKPVPVGEFKGYDYKPGYGDMDGTSIRESLYQNSDGDWIIERRAREDFESPMIVTTYLLTEADVNDFASFIKDNNVCGLEDRPDSDLFITDYSAWSYSIAFDNTSVGGDSRVTYSIWEYKEYSDEDMALLNELDKRFEDLHYNKISEVVEEEE